MGLFDFATKAVATATRTMTGGAVGMGQAYVSRAISQGAQQLVGRASSALRTGSMLDPLIQQTLYSAAGSLYGDVGTMTQSVLTGSLNKYINQTSNLPFSSQLRSTPGLSNQVGRYVFGNMGVKEFSSIVQPEYSGYDNDIQGSVPPEYIVVVRSTKWGWVVRGVMKEGFVMGANSKWSPLVPQSLSNLINIGTQVVTGKALASKWATRRIWTGTSPLSLIVNIEFNAVNNEFVEVVRPCLRLEQMALPSVPQTTPGGIAAGNYIPLMSPPGPSPFAEIQGIQAVFGSAGSSVGLGGLFTGGGDRIQIKIGKFLDFDNVIISQVGITYANKMTQGGYPIQSLANINFETYEMMTVEELAKTHMGAS